MLTKLSDVHLQERAERHASRTRAKATLWSLWALFLLGFAVVHWQFDLAAGRPAVMGLVIHTLLAALASLIVVTVIEMRLDPERFENRNQSCS